MSPRHKAIKTASAALIGVLFMGAAVLIPLASPARAGHVSSSMPMAAGHGPRLVMPIMNAERGKKLFVDKGCVACHAVNGVGGHDAPPMDAHAMGGLMNPFDFAAKMWNHAPGMIAAQEGAFGDQVLFTGDELADIIAFVHDDKTQHTFSEGNLTARAHKMMEHEHGAMPAPNAHAKEVGHGHEDTPMPMADEKKKGGHGHAPGTAPHND